MKDISLLCLLALAIGLQSCGTLKRKEPRIVVRIDARLLGKVADSDEYDAAKRAALFVAKDLPITSETVLRVDVTAASDYYTFCMTSENSSAIPGQSCTRVDPKKYPNLIAAFPDMAKELAEYIKKP
jgi:hypothetical protein